NLSCTTDKAKPPDRCPGVFYFRVTKWGFGVSGEFSCLLDYPGGSCDPANLEFLFTSSIV
ncbi:MAG: hypothetical protein ACAH83_10700, partial [Alphaproteobacteria bacterium]